MDRLIAGGDRLAAAHRLPHCPRRQRDRGVAPKKELIHGTQRDGRGGGEMTERQGGGLAEWFRRTLLGPYVGTIDRLEEEIERLQRTLADPEALRPLVAEALHREVQDAPAALATA